MLRGEGRFFWVRGREKMGAHQSAAEDRAMSQPPGSSWHRRVRRNESPQAWGRTPHTPHTPAATPTTRKPPTVSDVRRAVGTLRRDP